MLTEREGANRATRLGADEAGLSLSSMYEDGGNRSLSVRINTGLPFISGKAILQRVQAIPAPSSCNSGAWQWGHRNRFASQFGTCRDLVSREPITSGQRNNGAARQANSGARVCTRAGPASFPFM